MRHRAIARMSSWRHADSKTFNQSALDPEDMADHPVCQQLPCQVAHHLVDCDNDVAICLDVEPHRSDMRIDQGPLPGPVAADSVVPVDGAAVHAVRPDDIPVQDSEDRFHVTSIETIIEMLQQRYLVGHSSTFLPGSADVNAGPVDIIRRLRSARPAPC